MQESMQLSDVEIIGILRKYVQQSLAGAGALKGAPCEIESIVDTDNTHVITFLWEDTDGVSHESTLTVYDGVNNISEMQDVNLTGIADENILYYDSDSGKFKVTDAGAVSETAYAAIESLLS